MGGVVRKKRGAAKSRDTSTLDNHLPWQEWVAKHFPISTKFSMGERHKRLWEWFDALELGTKPRPRVDVWPRGGAKSSTGELGTVRVGCKLSRRFVLYVCETQTQANKHVQTISTHFEKLGVGRALNTYGNSKGWKRDQLRTAHGFNVAGYGLDVAARGVKIDDYRPDLIIFDDIDGRHDSPKVVQKKIELLSESVLPSGSGDCAVLVLQNKIHSDSIVAMLVDGRADFLLDREKASLEPAVRDLQLEHVENEDGTWFWRIIGGVATWAGQSLETCQRQINEWGRKAFLREAQHETDAIEDGLWDRDRDIEPHRIGRSKLPTLTRIAVAIDPSWASRGDEAGIVAVGVRMFNGKLHGYVLADRTVNGTPKEWSEAAVNLYHELKADVLLGEGNFMGELVRSTVAEVDDAPPVKIIFVSRGKIIRAEPVQMMSEEGRLHFVGHYPDMEKQCCTYKPNNGMDSPGRMDALVIAASELMELAYKQEEDEQEVFSHSDNVFG